MGECLKSSSFFLNFSSRGECFLISSRIFMFYLNSLGSIKLRLALTFAVKSYNSYSRYIVRIFSVYIFLYLAAGGVFGKGGISYGISSYSSTGGGGLTGSSSLFSPSSPSSFFSSSSFFCLESSLGLSLSSSVFFDN